VELRPLGATGSAVSAYALGTMTFGAESDEAASHAMLDRYLEAGGNFVDTADVYSAGASEEIIGRWLERGGRRDEIVLATKARFQMGEGPNDVGLSRVHIQLACEASLQRLGVDTIDLYQAHCWDPVTPLEETLAAFAELVAAGKVRYVGVSNYAGWQVMKALGIADRLGYQRFVSQQIYYSLQSRDAETDLVPLAIDQGLGLLIWSPLAGGLLSGKYRRGVEPPEGSRHLVGWDEPPLYDEDKLYDTVEVLVELAEARGVSVPQLALAYTLAKPGVTSVIVGARTDEQLRDNLGSADVELTEDELARLDAVSRLHLPYPQWHQLKTSAARFNEADWALYRGQVYGG
jgi:aryl-alcohol dehydrogenase-like predicted oxidoreductase